LGCGPDRRPSLGPARQAALSPPSHKRKTNASQRRQARPQVAGNLGVADAVAHIPFAIGYVESSYSTGPTLLDAAIRNQAGQYTTPTPASITADAAQKPDITPADFSIVNEPGTASYPICGYSWALIYTHQAGQATGQALVNLLDWLTHAGQASATVAGYVPLPPQIQQLARTMLQQVTGPNGTRLLS